MSWEELLDDRQKKELAFARLYAAEFNHGTDGHHRLNLIAKLSAILNLVQINVEDAVLWDDLIERIKKVLDNASTS